MPYVTSVAGGVITASWANANIRDQVVTPWASASTRTSGVSVPVEGMVSWLSDVKELDVYSSAAYKFLAEPNLYVSKALDESVTSSTALQNDDVLLLAVKANTVVEISAVVKYRAITGGEFKCGFTAPAAATMIWSAIGAGPGVVANSGSININGVADLTGSISLGAAADTNTDAICVISGLLVVSATAGTLQFQWAQRGSNGTATVVKAGSWIASRRVT